MSPENQPRPGFMTRLANAMAPVEPESVDGVVKRPTIVLVAMVLAIIGGVLFLANAAQRFTYVDSDAWRSDIATAREQYQAVADRCTDVAGGVGDAVASDAPAPSQDVIFTVPPSAQLATAEAGQVLDICRNLPASEWTDQRVSEQANSLRLYAGGDALISLAAIVGAVLMRNGSTKLRRILVAAVVGSLLLSMFVSSNTGVLALAGSMFMVVALVMVYIGKGGGFFLYQSAGQNRRT